MPEPPRENPRPPDPSSPVSISFEKYIDERLNEVRQAAALAAEVPEAVVDMKDYFEAILEEQRRGMIVAEQEREKAAKALRDELTRQIDTGDLNLREHIQQQVHQIREALHSAEKLEQQRFEEVKNRIDMLVETATTAFSNRLDAVAHVAEQHVTQLRRERELVTGAQTEAIAKAEAANEKRFESVNEFRAQLADQTAQFLPREVAEAQFVELRRSIQELSEKLNRVV